MATLSTQNNLSELDAMLEDLGKSKYDDTTAKSVGGESSCYGDYCSDYYADTGAAAGGGAPARPPSPKNYTKKSNRSTSGARSQASDEYANLTLPKSVKPPKLQHVLVHKRHDLVKAVPRDDGVMKAPDFEDEDDNSGRRRRGGGGWTPDLPCPSDEELEEQDAGETPRGDKSMVIKTDHGDLKSKYIYLGFGLWENTDKRPPPPKRPSPPPPPPKAEPIWYNCSVAVETHKTSKELDDLFHDLDGYDRMARREVEVGTEGGDVPGDLGDIYEEFEKEDMSDMFKRAFLEKLALVDDEKPRYKCHVCSGWILGRVITAMSKKFHPECFVCTYCRKEFKERSFKSDSEGKPYCYECFEKLLGHFGSARFKLKEGAAVALVI